MAADLAKDLRGAAEALRLWSELRCRMTCRGVRLVSLASDEAVTRFAQLEVVMCQWRRIESLLTETGPFIYFATRTSVRKARLPR